MLAIPTSAKTNLKKSNMQQQTTMTSKLFIDMVGYVVIGIAGAALIVFEMFSLHSSKCFPNYRLQLKRGLFSYLFKQV